MNKQLINRESNLVSMLKEQTQSLKKQFVAKCIDYASEEHDRLTDEHNAMKEIDWAYTDEWNDARINNTTREEVEAKYSQIVVDKGFVSKHAAIGGCYKNHYSHFTINKSRLFRHKVFTMTKNEYVKKAEKDAIRHYNNSITRLALRIEKKELNQNNLKMVTSHIDVNITTTITDGEKTVKAWTIIASGEIQRPHYRYLVK